MSYGLIAVLTWIAFMADINIFENTGLHMTRYDIIMNDLLGWIKIVIYLAIVIIIIRKLGGNK